MPASLEPYASMAFDAFSAHGVTVLLCILLFSPVVYIVLNNVVPLLLGTQNLKKKYGATWALVTGSSSGIGKELARTLLRQGLNVILDARKEPVFDTTMTELTGQFPERQILRVDANLSDPSGEWMAAVQAAVGEHDVQCVFLNAGYIVTGMFEQHAVQAHLANLHCNLTSNIWLSHFLYQRMLAKKLGGCIVFTSSSASYIPNPFAALCTPPLHAPAPPGLAALAAPQRGGLRCCCWRVPLLLRCGACSSAVGACRWCDEEPLMCAPLMCWQMVRRRAASPRSQRALPSRHGHVASTCTRSTRRRSIAASRRVVAMSRSSARSRRWRASIRCAATRRHAPPRVPTRRHPSLRAATRSAADDEERERAAPLIRPGRMVTRRRC